MKNYLTIAFMSCFSASMLAQEYCVPPPYIFGPFTGITAIHVDDYVNTSPHYNGYIFYDEEVLPELGIGDEHQLKMECTHELAGQGFSGNLNYRIWIDWNQDGDFEDDDEEVMSIDGTYYSDDHITTFTVPEHVIIGTHARERRP